MVQQGFPATRAVEITSLGLQAFQVAFLWIHDWIPLGPLNDVAAVHSQNPRRRLIAVTLLQSIPWTLGLLFCLAFTGRGYPGWIYNWLLISYSALLLGQIFAWWIPYLIRPDPQRSARYRIMFGKTHSFLPSHNGMVPNTAHILLHLATAGTLICLLVN